jgi:hypothetical protein
MFIAPELIIPDEDDVSMFVTKASDVYAFSMTGLQVSVWATLTTWHSDTFFFFFRFWTVKALPRGRSINVRVHTKFERHLLPTSGLKSNDILVLYPNAGRFSLLAGRGSL